MSETSQKQRQQAQQPQQQTPTPQATPQPQPDPHRNREHTLPPRPKWLEEARFYEIYPQSFADSNGDGIGDIPGICSKLDYIKDLGCNALWINPCFDSPFKDAGYDVLDYRKVAPRYGTNDDLVRLFAMAHERGMHVLLDLVPGHTSEEHEWFQQSRRPEHNEYSDRYIWTGSAMEGYSMPFIGGESERDGAYILNFFKCQPALNYGFAHRDKPWQMPPDSPAALRTQQAMIDVMEYWLALGCDGFRVDMANSLVKNDGEDKPETIKAWRRMFTTVKNDYPNSAFVSEWGVPDQALSAGFDMDFYLDWRWDGNPNGYAMMARDTDDPLSRQGDASYFNSDSGQSATRFLDEYLPRLEDAQQLGGYFSLITCNHDTPRLAPRLSERERKVAYGMLLTLPGVPFVYYGDELGMSYRKLHTKEGGFSRTGSRTPMQWDHSANLGFSTAPASQLYLPVEDERTTATVADQSGESDSMLNWVKSLLHLRDTVRALDAGARLQVLAAASEGRSLVYERFSDHATDDDRRVLVALNPGTREEQVKLPESVRMHAAVRAATALGTVQPLDDALSIGPQSFAVFIM